MTEVEIVDMREYPRMIRPGFIETLVRVTYRTPEGYTGTVEVPKPIATEEKIQEEIKRSVTGIERLIGTKIKVTT